MSAGPSATSLLLGLADRLRRPEAAAAVASAVGSDAFYALVRDDVVGAFVPAPGFPQTLPNAAWRAVVDCCRSPGARDLLLAHEGRSIAAHVTCRDGAALVFVGSPSNRELVGALVELLPVIAAIFRNEQVAAAAAGELNAAQDAVRHARLLSAALSAARADMERALANSARLNHELQDADRRKNEFLAMLAHELRNPLSPIVTALQLVLVRRERGEPFDHELDVMGRQLAHLTRLVDDLLDVSRITRGRIELRLTTVSLAEVLGQAFVTAGPLVEKKKHRLEVSGMAGDLLVRGDFVRLVQVFANLLNNAAKYTDPGGLVEVRVARVDGQVRVAVRDNGIGISPSVVPHVFDLFVQAPRALDRAQGGLGIGLTLVKSLVEMQGGEVTACSAGDGKGSEFIVTLPLIAEASAPDVATASPSPPTGAAALHLLVVDDNVDAAELLADILRLWGHSVEVAADGISALHLATEKAFDVVLLDIGLPGLDGLEVARRLRKTRASARIIAISGYGDELHQDRAREAGFDGYLVKPIQSPALEQLLGAHQR